MMRRVILFEEGAILMGPMSGVNIRFLGVSHPSRQTGSVDVYAIPVVLRMRDKQQDGRPKEGRQMPSILGKGTSVVMLNTPHHGVQVRL